MNRTADTRHNDDLALAGAAPYPRDLAACAAVLSFAAIAWFAWGSGLAPAWGSTLLLAGMLPAVIVGVTAIRTRLRTPGGSLHQGAGLKSWWLWLGVEVALILVGNIVLIRTGHPVYVICWTHLIMGLHFIPLARTYRIATLVWTGALCSIVAVGAAALQAVGAVPTGLTVGGLGGAVMVASAAVMLVQARTRSQQ